MKNPMLERIFWLTGLTALLAGCNTASPHDLPLGGGSPVQMAPHMPAGQEVVPPYGFIGFCLRHEADCGGGTDKPSDKPLTPDRWSELNAVNDFVNSQPQVCDEERYGVRVYWTYANVPGGDCEDLALEKRRLLVARGWPDDALLLATAKAWNGERHALLLVETDRGELVLDSKNWAIVVSADAPYVWEARQSRERPFIWVNLDRRTFHEIAAAKTASGASFGELHELRLDPHLHLVADGGPPGR